MSSFISRNNPKLKEVAKIDDKKLFNSFSAKKPTKIVIHGWQNSLHSPVSQNIKNAYLSKYDVNVIVVDWSHGANRVYHRSKFATIKVAAIIAELIDRLYRDYGLDVTKNLHVIGHSLGAHISGMAARSSRVGNVARVTGLDPAAPLFDYQKTYERLSPESAAFVEVIHTCGKRLGMREQLGHIDVYPNSGDAVQMGCANDYLGMCSHSRAYEIFIEALQDPNAFMAIKCTDWATFRTGSCNKNEKYYLGENVNTKARGAFFMKTNTVQPLGMGRTEPKFTPEEIEEDKSWQEWASKLYDWVM
ncbi:unnamed protein product [Nesidiocoris tenuis]|uniref:Lipase domain-containing protein n=1 Tax=Nesidiocoris tenuis TaxID=355587 RepID=A0A6H5GK38_9HEMI|nr:unnamed protein product [Nesidiocoris tenuis]